MKAYSKMMGVLLAASLVLTTPVLAASQNRMMNPVMEVATGTTFASPKTANALRIKFTDNMQKSEVFYLELTNAVWDDAAVAKYNATNKNGVLYEKQDSNVLKVTVSEACFKDSDKIVTVKLPILATVLGGDARVSVVSDYSNSTVSQGTFIFAEAN